LGALLAAHRSLGTHLIVVSNEVGLGVAPAYGLDRTCRDCLGQANQWLARTADNVILMMAGLSVTLRQISLV
jgi:adenosylcobinamide kinase/adenosylcobinamide-phosphate guanylyltransferase